MNGGTSSKPDSESGGAVPAEGYVRFRMILDEGPAPEHPLLEALNETRQRLFRAGLIGMNDEGIGFGNLSVRVADSGRFVISGTATGGKTRLEAADYCEVTACDIPGNTVRCTGAVRASAESMTHGAVYSAVSGIRCVIHIHNTRIWSRMVHGDFLRTPPEAEYGTPAMAEAVRDVVAAAGHDSGVVVMAGHEDGIIAYGPDIETSERLIVELERGPESR